MDPDTLIALVRTEIAKQEVARQETDDGPLRKLHNCLRGAAAAIEELMGSPAQNHHDGIISIAIACPACGQPMKIVRKPTDSGQSISGVCPSCGQRVRYS